MRLIILVSSIILGAAVPALAAPRCMARDDLVAALAQGFGEKLRAAGLVTGGGALVETFTADSGSWTLVVTRPDGVACIIGAGESWLSYPQVPGERM